MRLPTCGCAVFLALSTHQRAASPVLLAGPKKASGKKLPPKPPPPDIDKDKHLFFDEAEVTCRAGAGGRGAVITLPKRGDGPKLKRTADDDFELPPGGGNGGDVVLYVDPSCSDLLHLRGKGRETLVGAHGGDSLGLRDLPKARERYRDLQAASAADSSARCRMRWRALDLFRKPAPSCQTGQPSCR